ncbi:MAG: hypothetical protein QW318_06880 [Candidatus Caldarchaeum sp.]
MRTLAKVFGGLFLILGLAVAGYNVYWLVSRMPGPGDGFLSGLGAGFAVFFIVIGLAFAAVGVMLICLGMKR